MTTNNVPASVVLPETMEQMVARLTAENAALKAGVKGKEVFSLGVGPKGGIVVRLNSGQYPSANLYADQMERLLDHTAEIRAFIAANASTLKRK